MTFQPGQEIGAYRLLSPLGQGGMGVVFEAEDTRSGRRVAVKLLIAPTERGRRRFRREGQILQRLRHPNVVAVHECGEVGGTCFISLELIQGESLQARMQRQPLPWWEAARVMALVARGLEQAHTLGVLHRDLKPGNVLLAADGRALLTDFGLAKDERNQNTMALTKRGQLVGTPAYMPPEQLAGEGNVDARADVYGLGATLFAALTGGPPFQGDGLVELAVQISSQEPPPLSQLAPGVPAALNAIVARCLAKDPAERYPTAATVAEALEAVTQGGIDEVARSVPLEPAASDAPEPPAALGPPSRLERALLAGLTVIAVALLVVLVVVWKSRSASVAEVPPAPVVPEPSLARAPEAASSPKALPEPEPAPQAAASPQLAPKPRPTKTAPVAPRGFRYLRRETFAAGGQKHKVAVFRCEAFARALSLRVFESRPACEFVLVPGGSYLLGSPDREPERMQREGPQQRVTVERFLLARTELTQEVWEGLSRVPNRSHLKGSRLPLDRVSWNDAVGFLAALDLRLPSEAEWEYACRAGTTTAYAFGPRITPRLVNYQGVRGGPSAVGSFPANGYGLFDMHGNVWEWCQDGFHPSHQGALSRGWPARAETRNRTRVTRGGCWKHDAGTSRSANRSGFAPTSQFFVLGFRAARSYP